MFKMNMHLTKYLPTTGANWNILGTNLLFVHTFLTVLSIFKIVLSHFFGANYSLRSARYSFHLILDLRQSMV